MIEQRTSDYLDTLFESHEKAVLAFSGGKDSLVLAHLWEVRLSSGEPEAWFSRGIERWRSEWGLGGSR